VNFKLKFYCGIRALTILSVGIGAIVGCMAVAVATTYVFFTAYNLLSSKNISDRFSKKIQDNTMNAIGATF
jgi:ribonuclease HIII